MSTCMLAHGVCVYTDIKNYNRSIKKEVSKDRLTCCELFLLYVLSSSALRWRCNKLLFELQRNFGDFKSK